MPLVHHELCFGCGRANLFGLLVDVELTTSGSVAGRCFIKQDHQGAEPGTVHAGVLAAALVEAMELACGPQARAISIELELIASAAVGEFVELEAESHGEAGGLLQARAGAASGGRRVAQARGTFELREANAA